MVDVERPPRIEQLIASRARIVATADETRRRLQRDLHDGPQQRLAHAVIVLKVARDTADLGPAAFGLVEEALTNVERASSELRRIVHQLLPSSLTFGGLRTGLGALVADLGLPVDVRISAPRLPPTLETTAYLVVAEALADAARHAHAGRLSLSVELDGAILVVEVSDDGAGGVDPVLGTGLTGMGDRVDAAGGSLTLTSPPGGGTTVRAELPVPPGSVLAGP